MERTVVRSVFKVVNVLKDLNPLRCFSARYLHSSIMCHLLRLFCNIAFLDFGFISFPERRIIHGRTYEYNAIAVVE